MGCQLEHMLDQVARHGMIDMDIVAARLTPAHRDHHHRYIGTALGQAASAGIRYSLRTCAYSAGREAMRVVVDFSGPPDLEFNVEFPRAQIGWFMTPNFL